MTIAKVLNMTITNQITPATKLVLEASTLGWGPGQWPRSFRYGPNNFEFTLVRIERDREGDVVAAHYAFGSTMAVVFND